MARNKQLRKVDRAISALKQELKTVRKELDQEAARLVARGQYAGSKDLIQVAQSLTSFTSEVDALRERWRELCQREKSRSKTEITPLWSFYKPVARALLNLGGEANKQQLIPQVAKILGAYLKPGDLESTAQGLPIWHRAVARARRPMIRDGYLQAGTGLAWRLTPLGKKLAQQEAEKAS